jgi:hypothetical protein
MRSSGPEDLGKTFLWREKAHQSPLIVSKEAHERLPLSDFRVVKESPVVAMESTVVHADGLQDAWSWEEKNRGWVKRWESKKSSAQKERSESSVRTSGPHDQSEDSHLTEIGEVVWKTLPDFLPPLWQLYRSATSQWESDIKKHDSLPHGVQRWNVDCWTPLADLRVPLDWVFGYHRRLWQMRVYCSLFFDSYATDFWQRQGGEPPRYSQIRTSFAIQALSEKDLIEDTARSVFRSVSREVHEVGQDNLHLPSSVELADIRHLVVRAYFDRLCDFGFLTRSDSLPTDGSCGAANRLKAIFEFTKTLRYWLGDRSISGSLLAKIGRRWMEVARLCRTASERTYDLTNPDLRPYWDKSVTKEISEAVQQDKLRVTEDGIYDMQPELVAKSGS